MHLVDPERGFMGTSGIVGQGIPQATGVAYAAQIRKQGQVVLCFFGDGASKQGAFHESLNLASLWKLPDRLRDGEQQLQRGHALDQEDANAAAGEPLSVKARRPTACRASPSTAAIRSPSTRRSAPRSRGPAPATGPTLVESKVYRLSAHGNLIAPPGVPLHYPEHEAITVFGNREEYEAALRGDPVPAVPRAPGRAGHARAPSAPTRSPRRPATRWRRPCSSGSTARSRSPKRPLNHVYA